MLVRCVTGNLVDKKFQVTAVSLLNKFVKVGQVAEQWIDRPIITDVIAKIVHRGFEKGRYPYAINTQRLNVIQFFNNAL